MSSSLGRATSPVAANYTGFSIFRADVNPLFSSSPFAAPNSRSPPKFDHSLTFALLLKNTPLPFPMVAPSQPKSRSSVRVYSTQTLEPSNFPLARRSGRHLHHVASISLPFSAASAYFPSPPGCTHFAVPKPGHSDGQKRQTFYLHGLAASFPSLCSLFRPPFLCFQPFAASFSKTPGVVYPFGTPVRCTDRQKCLSVSPLLATLTHSLSRKSFPCRSYENTGDGGDNYP